MKSNWKYFLNPLYWPVWLLIVVLWLLVQLPFAWQVKMGAGIGLLIKRYSKRSRHTAEVNLKLCFPELSEEERARLLTESFKNVGIGLFESAMGFWASERRLRNLVELKNGHLITDYVKQGKGVLIMGAHYTTLEIVGRACSKQYQFAVMYRPHKLGILNFIIERSMKKHYAGAIPRTDMRGMVRTLKRKKAVWYAADVNAGRKHSVFAPFFGVPTATTKANMRLPEMTDCVVLPLRHYRRKDGKGYIGYIDYPLENFPSGDMLADATRVNKIIEDGIRECPEQYLWQYKRFKTRPNPEDPRFY